MHTYIYIHIQRYIHLYIWTWAGFFVCEDLELCQEFLELFVEFLKPLKRIQEAFIKFLEIFKTLKGY